MPTLLPFIVDAERLSGINHTESASIVIVDVGKYDDFVTERIVGSRHLEYATIVAKRGETGGLLPQHDQFSQVLQNLGIQPNDWIVAHDRGGNLAASRFLWTLHAFGWTRCSLLNGSLPAWVAAGLPVENAPPEPVPVSNEQLKLQADTSVVMTTERLLEIFDQQSKVLIIDARSKDEFDGKDVRARRAGHIPGAKWLEWHQLINKADHGKLKDEPELRNLFSTIGIDDRTAALSVVAYCQTHQRSSLTYVVLRHLGFENVAGLEGAWSDWGNRDDTPVETEVQGT